MQEVTTGWGGPHHEDARSSAPGYARPLMTPSLTHRVWWLIAVLGLSAVALSGQEGFRFQTKVVRGRGIRATPVTVDGPR
jgi:hypothetical protein